ncbi:MAG: zinc ribbon domain-containing protein [Desulfamplus sp.]|nr:zinc ribbon domain-containing protein [Desulfamplus sp.]
MPIYEYKCKKCGKTFEKLVIGSDTPSCPSCSSSELDKLMSACGFISITPSGAAGAVQTKSSAGTSCSGCLATSCGTCGSK